MANKHTPAPWYVSDYELGMVKHAETSNLIACIYPCKDDDGAFMWGSAKEREANCDLISAAPDMLKALKRQSDNMAFILNHADVGNLYEKLLEELEEDRIAIIKAQGGHRG